VSTGPAADFSISLLDELVTVRTVPMSLVVGRICSIVRRRCKSVNPRRKYILKICRRWLHNSMLLSSLTKLRHRDPASALTQAVHKPQSSNLHLNLRLNLFQRLLALRDTL
jgi:hypothetical protein